MNDFFATLSSSGLNPGSSFDYPHGDGKLADAEGLGRSEDGGGAEQMLGAEDSDVGVGIVTDEGRARGDSIEEGQRHAIRSVDHMAVGEDEAVGGEDESGARAATGLAVADVDLDDGRADAVDRRCDGA